MPNNDNYPTRAELSKIAKWGMDPFSESKALLRYVSSIWTYSDYCRQRGNTFRLATGGWSGNEDIIQAMQKNRLFWTLTWYSSTRGGLYVFKARSG